MNFSEMGLAVNIGIFAGAAFVVWQAGSRITDYADEVAERFGLSRALIGLLLLAGITSLPEIATSVTAAANDNAKLAVNNLLGSIAMQVAILAVADGFFGKRALTSVVPDPVVILQGALNICLLALVAIAVLVEDKYFLGAGAWSYALAGLAAYSLYKLSEADGNYPWIVNPDDRGQAEKTKHEPRRKYADTSQAKLMTLLISAALAILAAGFVVAQTGDAIAQKSGLGSSFVGVAFVAIATSLPEASTVFASMRRGLYTMAISDILGTNILNIILIFLVDAVALSSPVLSEVGVFAAISALLGLVLTGLFMIGLAERRDRTVGRFGVDSVVVLGFYLAGMVTLYFMRG